MLIFVRLACMYSGRKINGKFKVEEGTPFQFISNLLFIFLELFRELIVYHEFSARSNMSQGGQAPSLTGVAFKRMIISSGGLVEELL